MTDSIPCTFATATVWLPLVACLSLVGACGADPGQTVEEGEPLDRSGFDLEACRAGETAPFETLTPGEPVDYLELREGPTSLLARGERCATATDRAACEKRVVALQAAPAPAGWPSRPGGGIPAPEHHFLFTRGDEVGLVGRFELAAFLAPITEAADAALLAAVASGGGTIDCSRPVVRRVPTGYEVITVINDCGGGQTEQRVLVEEDGSTEILESVVVVAPTVEICA